MLYLKSKKTISLIIGSLLILGVVGVLYAQDSIYLPLVFNNTGIENSPSTPVSGDKITEEDLGNGWILYTDRELGFSIEYPDGWYHEEGINSEACFAENSWDNMPVMNYPLVCVVLNPRYLKVPGEVKSTPNDYFEYINSQKVVAVSQYAQSGEQYVSGSYIVSGLEAVEEIRGEPMTDTESSYMVSIYVRHQDRGVYHIKIITFTQNQFKDYEKVLRMISNSFKIL